MLLTTSPLACVSSCYPMAPAFTEGPPRARGPHKDPAAARLLSPPSYPFYVFEKTKYYLIDLHLSDFLRGYVEDLS